MIYQPPYCPQLNPIEEVFDYIKENDFRNRVFDSLDDVENQLSRSVNTLQEDKHRLKSMTVNILSLNANYIIPTKRKNLRSASVYLS